MLENFDQKKANLKVIRDKFLRFHKVLMDWDRANYEREFGPTSAGKFLELLLSDERFVWLRTISTLIVRIDEAFNLDDGISNDMLEAFYTEISDMFDKESEEYSQFKDKLEIAQTNLPDGKILNDEIVGLLK